VTTVRVLVTDLEQRAALASIRSLGKAGMRVFGVTHAPHAIGGRSRYLYEQRVVPDPLAQPAAFATEVLRYAEQADVDVILPVSEAAHLALYDGDAVSGRRVAAAAQAAFLRAADKELARAQASRCGLQVPAQVVMALGATDAAAAATFPCVIKPVRSVPVGDTHRVKVGVSYAATPESLAQALGAYPASAFPVLLQERIAGSGLGVSLLRWSGQLLAASAHRRLREKPVTGGVSVLSETVALPDSTLARCVALLDALDYRDGVAMIEFKGDSLDAPTFMEINPRLWGTVQLAIDAGVDVPALLVRAALGQVPTTEVRSRPGVRLRWFWGDVDHMLARVRRGLGPDGAELPGGRLEAARLLGQERYGRAVEEVWRVDDWRPFVAECWNWLWRR
jgi:predicted ATP-grasp superfamily ATP-dependent carboligase